MTRRWLVFTAAALLAGACSAPEPGTSADSTAAADSAATQPDPETVKRVQTELNAAGRLMQQGKFDEALETASAAVAITPDRIEPYEVLSNWYVQLGRHDLAIEAFERLAAGSPHGLRYLARHQALSGEREAALVSLDRCVERAVRHPGCRFERARLQQTNGAFAEALEDLRVAYEIDSDPATAARLAEVLRVTGAYVEIRALVETALVASPDSIDLLLALARQQLRDRDDTAAFQTLRRTLELDPASHVALRMLGGLLSRMGNQAEGSSLLTRADLFRDYNRTSRMLKRGAGTTENGLAALMLAELELTIGNYQDAQRWLATARERGAPAQRLAATQAWTWYALGEVDKGDAELTRAGGEDDARANLARAARAARTGDRERAGQWLRRATARGPNERSFLHRAIDLYASIGDTQAAAELRLRAATAGLP